MKCFKHIKQDLKINFKTRSNSLLSCSVLEVWVLNFVQFGVCEFISDLCQLRGHYHSLTVGEDSVYDGLSILKPLK